MLHRAGWLVAALIVAASVPVSATGVFLSNVASETIDRTNLDGSGFAVLVPDAQRPLAIDIDESAGKIYWASNALNLPSDAKIHRADLDGSNVEAIVSSGLDEPWGLAVDSVGGKVYWTNVAPGQVWRADLDGSDVELLVDDLGVLRGMDLDLERAKMYWVNAQFEKIQRADLDGANVEDALTSPASPWEVKVDAVGGKLYWSWFNSSLPGAIQRADLDGSNVEVVVSGSIALAVALDVRNEHLYWSEFPTIQRADLDGTNREEFLGFPEAASARNVVIHSLVAPPDPVPALSPVGRWLLLALLLAGVGVAVLRLR